MLSALKLFIIIVQGVAIVTAAAAVFIIGVKRIDGVADDGKGEPEFFAKQFSYCRRATLVMIVIGWLIGDPYSMGSFPQLCRSVGVFWVILGALFVLGSLYLLFVKAERPIRAFIARFGWMFVTAGVAVTVVSYLLWRI